MSDDDWYSREADRIADEVWNSLGIKPHERLCNRLHHPGVTCICGNTRPTLEEAMTLAIEALKDAVKGRP